MEIIGSLLLILAVGMVVALFIFKPFLGNQVSRTSNNSAVSAAKEQDHLRSSLMAERDRILMALQELDFDYALGKVPEDEYPVQRSALLKNGAEVLRRLENIQPAQTSGRSAPAGQAETMEARIEAAVQARRADAVKAGEHQPANASKSSNGGVKVRDELEDIIASRKRERKESSAGFCPGCGKPVQKSDKFCSRCGTVL